MTDQEEDVKHKLEAKVSNIAISTLHKMLSMSTHETSHPIIQTLCRKQPNDPLNKTYYQSDVMEYSISCPVVLTSLHKRFGQYLFTEFSLLSRLVQAFPETAATAGWMWEARGHVHFCKGGRFTLVRMEVDEEGERLIQVEESETISIKSMTLTSLDPESVYEMGAYYVPASKRHATFDACFLAKRTQIALKFTISLSHTIEDEGLVVLNNMLPEAYNAQALVFVVPKARAERFTCPAPSSELQAEFEYYVLALDSGYRLSSADI